MNIIITGGTLCKTYDPIIQQFGFEGSKELITQFFKKQFIWEPWIHFWDFKDSRYLTEPKIKDLFNFCLEVANKELNQFKKISPFIIIYGTDTMAYAANYFYDIIIKDKTAREVSFIFTGSYIPLSLQDSDAPFNLGYAYSCAQMLKSGVYVAMNGQCLNASQPIRKRHELCTFEYIRSKDA